MRHHHGGPGEDSPDCARCLWPRSPPASATQGGRLPGAFLRVGRLCVDHLRRVRLSAVRNPIALVPLQEDLVGGRTRRPVGPPGITRESGVGARSSTSSGSAQEGHRHRLLDHATYTSVVSSRHRGPAGAPYMSPTAFRVHNRRWCRFTVGDSSSGGASINLTRFQREGQQRSHDRDEQGGVTAAPLL